MRRAPPSSPLRRASGFLFAILLSGIVAGGAQAGEAIWKALTDEVVPLITKGELSRAERTARQALAEARKSFGEDHRNTETSYANLALALRFRGRHEEAEKHYRSALALREKALGANHPSTALLIANLAEVIQAQGRHAEAEKLQRRVLPVFEKAYGDDAKTATLLNNLGAALRSQGRHQEAEPLLRRALTIKENTLGPYNPSVAHTLTNLADVLDQLGRKGEASKMRLRAAAITK
jgi:tetratricopeptide (TPR) repeat protein